MDWLIRILVGYAVVMTVVICWLDTRHMKRHQERLREMRRELAKGPPKIPNPLDDRFRELFSGERP